MVFRPPYWDAGKNLVTLRPKFSAAVTLEGVTVPGRRTRIRAELTERTRSFTELAQAVLLEGLQPPHAGFYFTLFGCWCSRWQAPSPASCSWGASWFQLLIAAALGTTTQFAFLGHEASHRQVLDSAPRTTGSAGCWPRSSSAWSCSMNKHTRHHGNPNKVGKDPDIDLGTVAFTLEDAAASTGFRAWIIRRQGWFFLPLLLLAASTCTRSPSAACSPASRSRAARWMALIGGRFALYLGLLFSLFPVGMAFAFLGVQLAVFGVYMGGSFAPNHVGMPDRRARREARLPRQAGADVAQRVRRLVDDGACGGLNYQIEHHLFPSMPRPHLFRARKMVLAHRRAQGVPYTETSSGRRG